jgi:hypothetical protein
VRAPEKFDEAWDDATSDDALDGWIALLRKKLAKLCRCVELCIHAFRENALGHLRELLGELDGFSTTQQTKS